MRPRLDIFNLEDVLQKDVFSTLENCNEERPKNLKKNLWKGPKLQKARKKPLSDFLASTSFKKKRKIQPAYS